MRDTETTTSLDNIDTLRWVWGEILGPRGRALALTALGLMLVATLMTTAVTFVVKELIDALAIGNRTRAGWFLAGILAILATGMSIHACHEYARELSWNDNFERTVSALSRLFFRRTVAELVSETNSVGAEQIESAKDRINNLLYLILFEGSGVIAVTLSTIVLATLIDPVAGVALCALVAANLYWFIRYNNAINKKVEHVDSSFRRAGRRLSERWQHALSVKSAGAEDQIDADTTAEIRRPLKADRKIWAEWYIWRNLRRSLGNCAAIVLILGYSIAHSQWSAGDFAAMFTLLYALIEKFGAIGHIMRHFTSLVARLKAVRVFLSAPPVFLPNEGIIYERNPTCTSPSKM